MTPEALRVDGRYIKDPSGKPVILRGVNVADPKSLMYFRRERPYDCLKIIEIAVKEWGANVVRLPVHPEGIDDVAGFEGNVEKYLREFIVPAVDKAAELGAYAIIDLHLVQDYGAKKDDALVRGFWKIAASYYRGFPSVMFELYNEPINPDNWHTWRKCCQPWVDMIRGIAPDNLILVGGPRWCQNMAAAAGDPVEGKNVVYAAHCYPSHLADFGKNWGPLIEKYPVMFTEWGYETPGSFPWQGTTSGFGRPFLERAEALGCSWCAWCFDNDWGPRVFDKPWSVPEDREGRMGIFLKEALKKQLIMNN